VQHVRFQPQTDFVRRDAQDAPDLFTVDVPDGGRSHRGLARREDGSFFDKFISRPTLPSRPQFSTLETREGVPAALTVALTAPTDQKFT
jgi:hypothetical protein